VFLSRQLSLTRSFSFPPLPGSTRFVYSYPFLTQSRPFVLVQFCPPLPMSCPILTHHTPCVLDFAPPVYRFSTYSAASVSLTNKLFHCMNSSSGKAVRRFSTLLVPLGFQPLPFWYTRTEWTFSNSSIPRVIIMTRDHSVALGITVARRSHDAPI